MTKNPSSIRRHPYAAVLSLALGCILGLAWQPAILGGGRLLAQAPSGPDTTSSTTDDATGTVAAITATTISVTDKRGPFTYRIGPDLHVVGPEGTPLTTRDVHKGQTVTVYYYLRDGQQTVARIAVLEKGADKDKDRSVAP